MPTPEPLRVMLLFGGNSAEFDVSLISAAEVLAHLPECLDERPLRVFPVVITRAGRWLIAPDDPALIRDGDFLAREEDLLPAALLPGGILAIGAPREERISIDVAFSVMHGDYGEDGRVQGLLSTLGLPFVGSDWASSAVCMDKAITAALLCGEDIPQARKIVLRVPSAENPARALAGIGEDNLRALGCPLFVKPACAGSSVGCHKVEDLRDLPAAVTDAASDDAKGKVLIEEYIAGREVECAVLEEAGRLTVPPPGEIDPGAPFYDYDTKYKTSTARAYLPARISLEASDRVRALAAKIFTVLGCRDLARVDFFVRGEEVLFNEINTLPGFTPISMYPKLLAAAGIPYETLLARLLRAALRRG